MEKFPCISLAYQALKKLGTSPAALNLANDYSVQRFLKGEIKFLDITTIVKKVLESKEILSLEFKSATQFADILNADLLSRDIARTVSLN